MIDRPCLRIAIPHAHSHRVIGIIDSFMTIEPLGIFRALTFQVQAILRLHLLNNRLHFLPDKCRWIIEYVEFLLRRLLLLLTNLESSNLRPQFREFLLGTSPCFTFLTQPKRRYIAFRLSIFGSLLDLLESTLFVTLTRRRFLWCFSLLLRRL